MIEQKEDEEISVNKMKIKKYLFFAIPISLIALIIIFAVFFLNSSSKKVNVCGDDTSYNSCSETKPYFCEEGILIEKVSICGCSNLSIKDKDKCILGYQTNPQNITLKYILNGNKKEINFTVYEGGYNYVANLSRNIFYKNGEKPSRADFKLKGLNDPVQKELLLPLIVKIQNLALDKEDQARIAISIVQNFEWGWSGKKIKFARQEINYERYPYEVLFDTQGVCGEKSELLAFLLRELKFGVVFFYNILENHESIGIKCPLKYSWNNSGYCFVETTGPSIITDKSIEYIGGITIKSNPEVLFISEGNSLGEDLGEYKDAASLGEINNKLRNKGSINFFDNLKLKKLRKKYFLAEEYNIG